MAFGNHGGLGALVRNPVGQAGQGLENETVAWPSTEENSSAHSTAQPPQIRRTALEHVMNVSISNSWVLRLTDLP